MQYFWSNRIPPLVVQKQKTTTKTCVLTIIEAKQGQKLVSVKSETKKSLFTYFTLTTYIQSSGHALGIWICGCSLFYRRELWASKSAGFNSTKSLKICGCKRCCPKDLQVCAPAAPVLHNAFPELITQNCNIYQIQKSKRYFTTPKLVLFLPYSPCSLLIWSSFYTVFSFERKLHSDYLYYL